MRWFSWLRFGSRQQNQVSLHNNYGSITLINSVGGASVPVQLVIPWHPVANIDNPTPSQLLTWRGRLTPLIGREPELAALQAWVDLPQNVSVWPFAGEGGVGKTRLAAEFADELAQKLGWSAGFVDLGAFSDATELNVHQNTLLLVDYPEERPAQVARLVDLVNRYTGPHKLRVLLLTRDAQGARKCLSDRSASHLEHSKSWQFAPASLSPYELFKAAFLARNVSGEKLLSLPNESEFNAWLSKSPLHTSPLFVCAVALTARGRAGGLDLVGFDLLKRIAEDEMTKILRAAANDEQAGRAAVTAVALATAFDGLSLATLRRLPQAAALGLDANKLRLTLLATRHAVEPAQGTCDVQRLEPDLYAAAFLERWRNKHWNADTHDALSETFEHLWASAEVNTLVQHWNRLGYDASVRLGRSPNWFDGWFADSKFACDHAVAISRVLARNWSWNGLPRSAAANGNHLLSGIDVHSANDATQTARAQILNNASVAKASGGDRDGALRAAHEAAAIYRRLAQANPAAYEAALAVSVNNLAKFLSETGDRDGALEAAHEAVAIRRRLAQANPAAYEPDLAVSMNGLAICLSAAGDRDGALKAVHEGAAIYRRLAKTNPAAYEPDLAASVNNLSNSLSATGDRDGALKAAHDAVAIYRRLAEANTAEYEPDLAMSVSNLAIRLSADGDRDRALKAAHEGAAIYRRLAKANPAAYEPDLAMSVGNLANSLSETGDRDGALEASHEGAAIYRRLAHANPAAYEPELAKSVGNLAICLRAGGDREGALKAAHEAVTIYRRFADANPPAYEPDLAMSVGNLANCLSETGDRDGALNAAHEAVTIFRRLAKANATAHEPVLAQSLCVLAMALGADGQTPAARDAASEAVTRLTPLAARWPEAFGELLGFAKTLLAEIDAA